MVFLVTFAAILADTIAAAAHAGAPVLRDIQDFTRQMILDALVDAVANPVNSAPVGRPRVHPLVVEKVGVFKEQHANGKFHFHVAVKMAALTYFLPLKTALRLRSGLASHWSTSHTQFWSALRYCAVVTERKPEVDDAPLTLCRVTGDALNLYEESQEPFNASAWKRRREQKEMHADEGTKTKFRKLDLTSIVLANDLKTPMEVMEYAKNKGSTAMQAFVHGSQRHLVQFIEDAHAWGRAEAEAAAYRESDWAMIQRVAQESCPCIGFCKWRMATDQFFHRNRATIDGEHLFGSLAKVIRDGPSKHARVPLIAGATNCGKSTVLDPVDPLFGPKNVAHTPALCSTMPLANLAKHKNKRFLYFDEFRPVEYAAVPDRAPTIPVVTFLKLFGGQHMEVQVSQAFNDGNDDMRWQRGAAMTSKLDGLWTPTGRVTPEDVAHMQARVDLFVATAQLTRMRDVPRCKETFAKMLLEKAAAFASRRLAEPQADVSDDEDHGLASLALPGARASSFSSSSGRGVWL